MRHISQVENRSTQIVHCLYFSALYILHDFLFLSILLHIVSCMNHKITSPLSIYTYVYVMLKNQKVRMEHTYIYVDAPKESSSLLRTYTYMYKVNGCSLQVIQKVYHLPVFAHYRVQIRVSISS